MHPRNVRARVRDSGRAQSHLRFETSETNERQGVETALLSTEPLARRSARSLNWFQAKRKPMVMHPIWDLLRMISGLPYRVVHGHDAPEDDAFFEMLLCCMCAHPEGVCKQRTLYTRDLGFC